MSGSIQPNREPLPLPAFACLRTGWEFQSHQGGEGGGEVAAKLLQCPRFSQTVGAEFTVIFPTSVLNALLGRVKDRSMHPRWQLDLSK